MAARSESEGHQKVSLTLTEELKESNKKSVP